MRIAMLSPIAWRTPPRHYGPWESIVSLLTEGLIKEGWDVTLFATKDSLTEARLEAVCEKGYEEDKGIYPKPWECLHISHLFELADQFDIIHNHFDFLPLTYSGLVTTPVLTTIHGFSSPDILPVYEKYNGEVSYVSISDSDRSPRLDYIATIHHGLELQKFRFRPETGNYLLFFGRIHHEKGTKECIEIAKACGMRLLMAGIIQDEAYFEREIKPHIDGSRVVYLGSAGPRERDNLLGNAMALLHPINFEEPFGLSVIESMACGTPVVAFNRGSMPEIIRHEENGFLVSSIDEAIDAVGRIDTIDRSVCRRWVEERFTAERMVNDYIGIYERLFEMTKQEARRPWGYYIVLSDEPDHKVKRIVVYPDARLSLQRHKRREEHWHVLSGEAIVTRGNDIIRLKPGQSVDIPTHTLHRVQNRGPEDLVFIEIQKGDYFGEDDIERFEDDFGRA